MKAVADLRRQRQTDQAPPVFRHKIDNFRSDLLSCNREIAFVFAILVVDDDQHASGPELLDSFGNRRKWHTRGESISRIAMGPDMSGAKPATVMLRPAAAAF